MRKPQRSIQVARHEAAHAILAVAVGHTVKRIEMGRTRRGQTGLCEVKHGRCRDPLRHGIVALAGHAADMKWHRYGRWRRVSSADIRLFVRLGFRGEHSVNTVLDIARHLVDDNAAVIEALAWEIKRRDLTGRQFRDWLRGYAAADALL